MKLLNRLIQAAFFSALFLGISMAQSSQTEPASADKNESVGRRVGSIVDNVVNSIERMISGRTEETTFRSRRSTAVAKQKTAGESVIEEVEDSSQTFEGDTVIQAMDTVNATVVVKGGTLTVYGCITGDVLVVGGDLRIKRHAYIGGNVKIINGEVLKDDEAVVVGYIDKTSSHTQKAYREESKEFRKASTRLHANWVSETTNLDNFVFRYNRVDGLFLGLGSEKRYYWDSQKLYSVYGFAGYGFKAHTWRGNLGLSRQFALDDGQLFEFEAEGHSLTDSKDDWLIGLSENTAAAFLIHEDYRDYFQRNGYGISAGYAIQRDYLTGQLKFGYLSDEYTSLTNQTEWSLFGGNKLFRMNPAIDEGMMRSFVGSAGISTMTMTIEGHEGWSILGTAEVAKKSMKSAFDFNRYVADVRRYQPLGPYENLNVRIRVGTSEGLLPIQKAFDMGGLGSLPAFPFKDEIGNRLLLINGELILNGDFLGDLDFWPSWLFREINFVLVSDAGLIRTMPVTALWNEGFDGIHFSDFRHDVGVGIGTRNGSVRAVFVWRTDRSEPARLTFRIARPF
jgi:hypothetical protein